MVASSKKRLLLLIVLPAALLLLFLAVRIAVLTLSPENSASAAYSTPDIAERVQRGTIYDRNGMILATEIPTVSLALMLKSIDSREETAASLSPLIFMTASEILAQMEGKSTYALIKERLSREEESAIEAEISEGKLPGVKIEKRYIRLYPQTYHAAQLIGFTGLDGEGLEGIEYYFNEMLSPYPRPNETVTFGDDLYLTLDMRIQFFTDRQVKNIAEDHNPDAAIALVMDADSGELLAWSSYPWYDLNEYRTSNAAERLNRPAASMYEPGSVFKIYTLASILEIGEADTDEHFFCDGSYTFTMDNGKEAVIHCVSPHGDVGPREILKYSCNGAIAHYALQTDPEAFYEKLKEFNFSFPYSLPIPGEIGGLLSSPETWSGRSLPTISFGQEVGATALQMINASTVFSNKGNLVNPALIQKIVSETGEITYQFSREIIRRVISEENADNMLSMMVSATEPGGTAIYAQAEDLETAAKTGTAQILNPATGGYSEDHVLASCIALIPAQNPEYIIYIAVDNPKSGQYYGSGVAAPYIGMIAEDLKSSGLVSSSLSHFFFLPGQ